MFNINLNLILIAEMIEPILDGFILLFTVRLLWDHYHAGSNHWSLSGPKNRLEAENAPTTEKVFCPVLPGALEVEKPDRLKRNAILDLKLQLMVRPVVAGIQNHDLEPEPNIKRLSACMDFGSWSRTVARVWPNCCQVTLWLSLING